MTAYSTPVHIEPLPRRPMRSMWVWHLQLSDQSEVANLLAFCRVHDIGTLYVAWSGFRPEVVTHFCGVCQDVGIQVEVLIGSIYGALKPNHDSIIDLVKAGVAIPGPVGVHLDIEPHLVPGWEPGGLQEIGTQFLDLLTKVYRITRDAGLRLTADIPFWYDARILERRGVQRPLSECVLERVDRACIMDYRDTPDEIIKQARNEIAFAAEIGRDVTLGVETKQLDPGKVTFYEEGSARMDAVLEAVWLHYKGNPAMAGFAIHHYGTYKALRK